MKEQALASIERTILPPPEELALEIAQMCWEKSGENPSHCSALFEEIVLGNAAISRVVVGDELPRLVNRYLMKSLKGFQAGFYKSGLRLLNDDVLNKRASDREAASKLNGKRRDGSSARTARYRRRKRQGITVVRAEMSIVTGRMQLIEADLGRFSGLRINGRSVLEVTTEEAIRWSETRVAEGRFVRALCSFVADPRLPIGTQITKEDVAVALKHANILT